MNYSVLFCGWVTMLRPNTAAAQAERGINEQPSSHFNLLIANQRKYSRTYLKNKNMFLHINNLFSIN